VPVQPLKLYPTDSVVRISSGDTVNAMGAPCAVVPFHLPTLNDDEDGDAGPPHAVTSTPATIPIRSITLCIREPRQSQAPETRKGQVPSGNPAFAFFFVPFDLFVAFVSRD